MKEMNYPHKIPYENKKVWMYNDIFPNDRPYKLVSCFMHKSYSLNLHTHDFYEINFIVNGKGVHYTENSFKETSVGDIYVIPPGTYHGYHNIDNLDVYHLLVHKNFFYKYNNDFNMLSAFNILFNVDYKARTNVTIKDTISYSANDAFDELLDIFNKLDSIEYKTTFAPQTIDLNSSYLLSYSIAISIIAKLCEIYQIHYIKTDSFDENYKNDIEMLRVMNFIHTNYHKKITLEELCNVSFSSKTSLTEKFKKYIGQSPLNYVNYYRVQMAKRLIIETEKSISTIAQETGFFDASHLNKIYTKFEKKTPSELKDKLKKRNLNIKIN